MDIKQNGNQKHEIVLSDRKKLAINGVSEVISFDECLVQLETVCGELEVCGDSLKLSSLDKDKGEILLDGSIESVIYYDKGRNARRGFFGKLKS